MLKSQRSLLKGGGKFQQQATKGTPDAIARELKKLPESGGGSLGFRKRALHDLTNALINVEEAHEKPVVEVCEKEGAVALISTLVAAAAAAPEPEGASAADNKIKIGRRELVMGALETRLYALTALVNLVYIGGSKQLHDNGGAGANLLLDAVLSSDGPETEALLFYATAGCFNLSNTPAFAAAASAKPGFHARLQQLTGSSSTDTVKFVEGTLSNWKHHNGGGVWPPVT
tara:strand:- start:99 stop:788 length:690 start_codon:yes stop_codon:yes gene_type:complete